MNTALREVDMNCRSKIGGPVLRRPSFVRSSQRERKQMKLERPVAAIDFRGLQRRLYELLSMDFTDMQDFEDGRALTPAEIEETFYQHLQLLDAPTCWLLAPIMTSWRENPHTLLSARVVDVLCFRRSELRKGMELPLQDLLDCLLLSARLGEKLTVGGVHSFIRKLGDKSRHAAESVLSKIIADEGVGAECPADMPVNVPLLYLRLRDGIRPPLNATSHLTGRYYTMAFDDLIAMDDAVPLTTTFYDHQPHVTPLMRGFTCEVLCELALSGRIDIKMDTYFLATTLLDRYLALTPISPRDLDLFGAAALVAATKYEEIYTIGLDVLCARNGHTISADMIRNAEVALLTALQLRVGVATISSLANTMIVEQDPPASQKQRHLLLYMLMTLSLRTHYGQYRQSLLAAAAVYISRVAFAIPTGEPDAAVRDTLPVVLSAVEGNSNPALNVGCFLRQAFAHQRYGCVSQLPLCQLFR